MKRIVTGILVLLGAALAAPAAAQDGGTQSVFSIGAGSRSISLGGSYVSMANDASAIYWNPAALRNVDDKQLMFMYMPLFGDFTDATYTFLGYAYPTLSAGSFGVGLQRISSSFEGYDASSRSTGDQDYSETQVLIGYAVEHEFGFLSGRMGAGLNFKIGNQKIASLSSTSPGIDLGFRYVPNGLRAFALAINFQDLVGPSYKLQVEEDQIPRTILFGADYQKVFGDGSALHLTMQLDFPQQAETNYHIGAEYAFTHYAALRLGVDEGDFTFGIGFDVRRFGLDYAFYNRDTAGSSHPVTFTVHHGQTLEEQQLALEKQRAEEEQRAIQAAFDRRVQSHRDLAAQYQTKGNLVGAVDEWKIVLEYVPGDAEATKQLAALSQQLVADQAQATRDLEKQTTISNHFSQGLAFYQQNDYVRAREQWQAVLAVDSTHAEAQEYLNRTQKKIDELLARHINRAQQFEAQQRYTEAISEWNNVQVLDPNNRSAPAAIERIQRKIEAQSQDLQQAARRLKIVNLYDSALQAFNQGNYQKSMQDLDQLLALEPNHEEAKNLRALAKRKLTPLTPEEEAEIRRLYLQGMQFFAKDQYAEAIAQWEKILDIDPTNESVKRNIEEAKARLKQLEDNGSK